MGIAIAALLGVMFVIAVARASSTPHRMLARSRLHVLIETAACEAAFRGQTVIDVEHVARAVMSDARVCARLVGQGVDIEAFRQDLEAGLPSPAEKVHLRVVPFAPAVERLIHRSLRWRATDAEHVLAQLLKDAPTPSVAETFDRHRVTARDSHLVASRADGDRTGAPVGAGPYRTRPTLREPTNVVFWNDDKSTMELVVSIMIEVVGLSEHDALTRMLEVHNQGRTTVRTVDRTDAERLAARAVQRARDAGYPLRVTTEPANEK